MNINCQNITGYIYALRFYIGPGTSSTIASNGGGGGVVAATRGIAAEFSLLAYIKSVAAKLTGYDRLQSPSKSLALRLRDLASRLGIVKPRTSFLKYRFG